MEVVGDALGVEVGLAEGEDVGFAEGEEVGVTDGVDVGFDVGLIETVGLAEGVLVGVFVGVRVGVADGMDVGEELGEDEGLAVGVADGVEVGEADGWEDGVDVGETVGSTLTDGALLMEGAADTCSKQKSQANGQASRMLTSFSKVIPSPILQYSSRRRSILFSFFVIHSHPRSLSGFNLFAKV